MSNSGLNHKGWQIPESLKKRLLQLQKPKDRLHYRNNFQKFRLKCCLCEIEHKSGMSGSFFSIGALCRHVDNVHRPTDVDGKKLKDEYLIFLKYFSIVINCLNGNHEVLIDFIKFVVNGEIL